MAPKKDSTKKKPGGQPGNKNAERHGFFGARFTPDEKSQLTKNASTELDVTDDIALLRVYINRLVKLLPLAAKKKEDAAFTFTEKDLAALNTLTNMTIAVSTLVRTHYLIKGKGSETEKTIQQALEEIRLELGI